ncbi:amidase [Pollutimonas nitritireducens]|uniref:Amidase n=1 Tax=Pollutimonas nitritireducens TaxID=2045209 RepID=A0A2N4UAT0_9BURK|nr:amidase [Pollutimonas nitritireducens]PLC52126.1 amidase [Pollutimonas nitritireducens]
MKDLPLDPFSESGLEGFAKDFRAGKVTSEEVTKIYLERIEKLDSKLQAYESVAAESALATARAMDLLIKSGTDLGPLMGVPVAIKDVFLISHMPRPHVGSNMELPDILGFEEATFIKALRKAGCVLLGQTKAVELCLGITGHSAPRGTPWNPTDMENQRAPGGSSSGSGVAMAAGLCAFAIGSDSGGSVRVPAAFNGVFGLKTTAGLWPTDGAFPLDPRVDSIGLLTRSAKDALLAFKTISSVLFGCGYQPRRSGARLDRLCLGVPQNHFGDNLNPKISEAFLVANEQLKAQGCLLEDIVVPEAPERAGYFPVSMPSSLLSVLGMENFLAQKHLMDPVIAKRVESGLDVKAYTFLALEDKRTKSRAAVEERFIGYDAWVSPTTADFAPLISDLEDPEKGMQLALGMTQNTQPANHLGLCSISLPLPVDGLPIGYQLMGAPDTDLKLLEIAVEIEKVFAG